MIKNEVPEIKITIEDKNTDDLYDYVSYYFTRDEINKDLAERLGHYILQIEEKQKMNNLYKFMKVITSNEQVMDLFKELDIKFPPDYVVTK